MRVCLILEGCYPYVFGGVSSWTHQFIQAMPDVEFVLWCIGANKKDEGKYKFELPKNVVEIHEVFLDSALMIKQKKNEHKKERLNLQQEGEVKKLFLGETVNWNVLFEIFQSGKVNPVSLLMSDTFLNLIIDTCKEKYPYVSFSDYFYNVRSMLLPEMYLLTQEPPKADLYHSLATGYSGLLGSLAKWKYKNPFIVSEHGIYTREREEELLRANWILPYFRKQWIRLFYMFSECAYEHADQVTALFYRANDIQKSLGCPPEKLMVIENGVHYERFCDIPQKEENGYVDIGAVVRIAKIKDIKTMIYAFAEVKEEVKEARLHILGDVDDKEYFEECKLLIEQLEIEDIIFTGVVNVIEYMKNLDFTILTSISEGQPLSVLESFAAGRACVTTDVGCCRELIEGHDEFGDAGICVPPMHKEQLAMAIIKLCKNKQLQLEMGEIGKKRVKHFYTHQISVNNYRKMYSEVLQWQESDLN